MYIRVTFSKVGKWLRGKEWSSSSEQQIMEEGSERAGKESLVAGYGFCCAPEPG